MSKLSLVILLSLLTSISFAESGENCGPSGKMMQNLDLQEDQIEAVQQVMNEQKEKRHELMQASRDSIKDKMSALHEETKNKLSPILTPEQLAKFEQAHAERMEKREQRREERKEKFKNVSQTTDNSSDESI